MNEEPGDVVEEVPAHPDTEEYEGQEEPNEAAHGGTPRVA
jgi:hypothetical protein